MKNTLILLYLIIVIFTGCIETNLNKNADLSLRSEYVISVNDTIQFSLDSNPTTAYRWDWVNKESVVTVASNGSQYIPDAAPKDIVGRGGKELWKFVGIKSGIDSIKLVYHRTWETSSAIKSVSFLVKVK
ncbi:MAG: protease inhibitor I42 family protein [Ignavibacteriales bacterium]|nr:protease inhibitor I42 family protein [Ignavibacteriales bacterium]